MGCCCSGTKGTGEYSSGNPSHTNKNNQGKTHSQDERKSRDERKSEDVHINESKEPSSHSKSHPSQQKRPSKSNRGSQSSSHTNSKSSKHNQDSERPPEQQQQKKPENQIQIMDHAKTKAALQATTLEELFQILELNPKYAIAFEKQNIELTELTNLSEVDIFNLIPNKTQRETLQVYIKAIYYAEARAVQKYNEEHYRYQNQHYQYQEGGRASHYDDEENYQDEEYHDQYRDQDIMNELSSDDDQLEIEVTQLGHPGNGRNSKSGNVNGGDSDDS